MVYNVKYIDGLKGLIKNPDEFARVDKNLTDATEFLSRRLRSIVGDKRAVV